MQTQFWMLCIPPHSTIKQGIDSTSHLTECLSVTNVALDQHPQAGPHVLKAKVKDVELVIATLSKDSALQCRLALKLEKETEFSNLGPSALYLSGSKIVTLNSFFNMRQRGNTNMKGEKSLGNGNDSEDDVSLEGKEFVDDGDDTSDEDESDGGYPELNSDDMVFDVGSSGED